MEGLVKREESRVAVVTGFDSEILGAFVVFNVLFVQDTVLRGHFKKLRGNIFDSEFNMLVESLLTDGCLFKRFADQVKRHLFEGPVWPFSP
jgi:hypothetical protein